MDRELSGRSSWLFILCVVVAFVAHQHEAVWIHNKIQSSAKPDHMRLLENVLVADKADQEEALFSLENRAEFFSRNAAQNIDRKLGWPVDAAINSNWQLLGFRCGRVNCYGHLASFWNGKGVIALHKERWSPPSVDQLVVEKMLSLRKVHLNASAARHSHPLEDEIIKVDKHVGELAP